MIPSDAESNSQSYASLRTIGFSILWLGLPLLAGLLLASALAPQPAVGIIRLNSDIWSGSVSFVLDQIEEARQDPAIKAIVLQLDSPGGEVAATQVLYFELQSLRREMPIVASIDTIAASGGYYTAMATDPIFAKPSSTIGNIGVWGFIPPNSTVDDVILASGPFKLTASNRDEFLREIEGIKQEFIATVVGQRAERLDISVTDLTQGLAYAGREALRLGLIDHIGSQTDAVAAAAELAGIVNYQVIDLEARVFDKTFGDVPPPPPFFKPWIGAADPISGQRILPPGVYLLYDIRLRGTP